MKVAILTIGDEVIIGKTVNTNASYVAKVLESNHFIVTNHLAVRDIYQEITDALDYLYKDASVVITTGGLGPTVDDLTKEVCAKYFKEEMILSLEELEKIKGYFHSLNVNMTDNNIKQAYFIKDSFIIKNDNGTAPGMIFEKNQKMVINLPGPPKELEPMINDIVIPYLKNMENVGILEKRFRLMNIGESQAETLIKSLYEKYPTIKVSPYASVGVVDYMISTSCLNYKTDFGECCKGFEQILGNYIIGDWSKSIQEIIVELMSEKNLTLAIAESCTGGMVTSSIVDVSGSSRVLLEGLVTYSNEAKVNRLGIKETSLNQFGAVSKEVAEEMAINITKNSHADIGLAITGIAGPTGGTSDKPVGLVHTAIYYQGHVEVYRHQYNGDRMKVRVRTMMGLMYQLYQLIKTL